MRRVKKPKLTNQRLQEIERLKEERLFQRNCELNATHKKIRVLARNVIDNVRKKEKIHAQRQQKRLDNAGILFFLSFFLLDLMSRFFPSITGHRGDIYECTDSTFNEKFLWHMLSMLGVLLMVQEVCNLMLIDTGVLQKRRIPTLLRYLPVMANGFLLLGFVIEIFNFYGKYKTVSRFSTAYCEVASGVNIKCNAADEMLEKHVFMHPVLKHKTGLIQSIRNFIQATHACQKSVDLCYDDYLATIKTIIPQQSFLDIMTSFFKACIEPVLIPRVQLDEFISSMVTVLLLPLYCLIYSSYLFRDYARARVQDQSHHRLLYLLGNLCSSEVFKQTKATLEFDRIKDTTDLYKITVSNISKKNKEGGCDPEKLAVALATLGQVLFNKRTSQSTFQILLQRSMSWSCWWRSRPFEGLSLQKTLVQYDTHSPVSLPRVHRRRKQSKRLYKILKKKKLTVDQSTDDEALPDYSWSIQGRTYQCVADDVIDWQNELNVFRFQRGGTEIFFCFSTAVIEYIQAHQIEKRYLSLMVLSALQKRTLVAPRKKMGMVYCRDEAKDLKVPSLEGCWYKIKHPRKTDRIWASKFFDADESLPPLYQFSQATTGKRPYKPQIKIAANGRTSPST